MNRHNFLSIDIGGTWIKGVLYSNTHEGVDKLPSFVCDSEVAKVCSPLSHDSSSEDIIKAINLLLEKITPEKIILSGIAISTPGIVSYDGSKILTAATHLNALTKPEWKEHIEANFSCPAIIINDSDAAAIGAAHRGYLSGNKSVGVMPIGTGLGFTVWRNGRRWQPSKIITLLGSIRLPDGGFDSVVSASALARKHPEGALDKIFSDDNYRHIREDYMDSLVMVINTAAIIYGLDEVTIGGGLADAVMVARFDLEGELNKRLSDKPIELSKPVKAILLKEGNKLPLIGALLLSVYESFSRKVRYKAPYKAIYTETPYDETLRLEKLSANDIVSILDKAERESALRMEAKVSEIATVAEKISERVSRGGRMIYVGAGTSGRIAAMDAVEIPCTYGFPEDKILCYIAGGISDAAIEIESNFEEDASSLTELLMTNLTKEDVVIGISASGTAYFVQSALAAAKLSGAYSVMIQVDTPKIEYGFCDTVLSLDSGYEVVAGSTRMKAGTATKKMMNYLSSTVMILQGKVAGSYMIDVACINEKLIKRAESILNILYGIDKERAYEMLKSKNFKLYDLIRDIENV